MQTTKRNIRPGKQRVLSWLPVLWVIVTLSAGMLVYRKYSDNPLPIRYIRVEGAMNHINPSEIAQHLQHLVGMPSYRLDLSSVERAVRQSAWVDQANVARLWPDTIRIRISEQKPMAIWGDEGFVNNRGELFYPGSIQTHTHLPRLYGPSGSEKQLLAMLHALNKAWKSRGIKISRLTLSERQAWSLVFDSGLNVIYGKKDPSLATIKLERVLPALGEQRFAELASVDVRYANGMALVWKQAKAVGSSMPLGHEATATSIKKMENR
ncbi:MAG: cell division protein FtsQ/DivIB [Methylococcaceae bacterium]